VSISFSGSELVNIAIGIERRGTAFTAQKSILFKRGNTCLFCYLIDTNAISLTIVVTTFRTPIYL
jgi:hypothetical protein